jgi:hypothetical protein
MRAEGRSRRKCGKRGSAHTLRLAQTSGVCCVFKPRMLFSAYVFYVVKWPVAVWIPPTAPKQAKPAIDFCFSCLGGILLSLVAI